MCKVHLLVVFVSHYHRIAIANMYTHNAYRQCNQKG